MSERSEKPFSPAGLDMMREAAQKLVMSAPGLVDDDPHLAMAALALAAATVAALVKMPYADLVKMITDHYEAVMVDEAKRELGTAWVTDKPADKS